MANSKSHNGAAIINQMSLISFGLGHGRIGFTREKSESDNREYAMCYFISATGEKTRVTISEKLQPLFSGKKEDLSKDSQVIKDNMRGLQVIEFEVSDELKEKRKAEGRQLESYQLCRDIEVNVAEDIDWAAAAGI